MAWHTEADIRRDLSAPLLYVQVVGRGRRENTGGEECWSTIPARDTIEIEGGRLSLPGDFAPPPVILAPTDELARAALAAPAVQRLASFVGWVGDGRRLDAQGELTALQVRELVRALGVEELEPSGDRELDELVEAASVSLVVEWAELSGLVSVDGSDLNAARSARELSADPPAFWQAACEARVD